MNKFQIMLTKILKIDLLLLCLVLFGAIFLISFIEMSDIFKGTILGLVISYCMFLIGKYHELSTKRYNCLVNLSLELNTCINDLSDNLLKIERLIASKSIYLLMPLHLAISEKNINEVARIDLKNDLYKLFLGLRKFNHDMSITVTYFDKYMVPTSDKMVTTEAKSQYLLALKPLQEYGKMLVHEIKQCMVKTRYFLEIDKPFFANKCFLNYYGNKDYDKWIKEDMVRLDKELSGE